VSIPERVGDALRYVARVARRVQLRELLVGIEGLALLRHLYDRSDEDADQRLAEVRTLLDNEAFAEREGGPSITAHVSRIRSAWKGGRSERLEPFVRPWQRAAETAAVGPNRIASARNAVGDEVDRTRAGSPSHDCPPAPLSGAVGRAGLDDPGSTQQDVRRDPGPCDDEDDQEVQHEDQRREDEEPRQHECDQDRGDHREHGEVVASAEGNVGDPVPRRFAAVAVGTPHSCEADTDPTRRAGQPLAMYLPRPTIW